MSYGGIAWAPPGEWIERLGEWLSWAWYLLPSPLWMGALVGGTALLLAQGWRRRPRSRELWLDITLVVYATGYLIAHTVLGFGIWDRYLLPLVIPTALLLSRVAVYVPSWCAAILPTTKALGRARTVWILLAIAFAIVPAWKAAHNGYPVGGEHWAYQGLEQVVAYLQAHAPPDAVIYHHWLRWHYEYYLHGTDYELRWWESGEHLYREATRTPERTQYLVLPDWGEPRPDVQGIALIPVYEARRADGSISMRVFRVRVLPTVPVLTKSLRPPIMQPLNPSAASISYPVACT